MTRAEINLTYTARCAMLAVLLAGCALLTGCGKQWSWNEKIVVEVQTPAGLVTGTTVLSRGLTHQDSSFVPPEARGATFSLLGEAAILEVGPSQYLFALLKDLPNAFEVFFAGEAPVKMAQRLETLRENRELSTDQYPMLVRFTDINDPTTVHRVDPDNLAASFGPGVSLKRITFGITGDNVTSGRVRELLPWIGGCEEPKFGPGTGKTRNPLQLSPGNFVRDRRSALVLFCIFLRG